MIPPSPAKLTRKQQVEKDVERWKNAKVSFVNKPNPMLMRIALSEIISSNMRRLEERTEVEEI